MPVTATPRVAPLSDIRAEFPALARQAGGRPVAYFDGPGGTQVPRAVVDAMTDYLYHHNANTHWAYPSSVETDAAIAAARATAADLLGGSPDEVAFGANMTTLTFHLARALGRGWGKGDTVVVTELDHHANVAPWTALERDRGIGIRRVRLDPASGRLDWDDLERALALRPRLLAIGAASNALGTVTDVAAAAALAREAGALVFVDGVHYTAHLLPDVRALGADFFACSAYKFYGPHIGLLWGRRELIEGLDVPRLEPAPDTAPERLETGTLAHEGIVGAAAAIDFLAALAGPADAGGRRARLARSYEALHQRGLALVQRLWDGLSRVRGLRLVGPAPDTPRTATVSFIPAAGDAQALAARLAADGLFVSSGDFYAPTAVERVGGGAGGLLRVGCACYTTGEEIERLIEAVARA